uniref:Programmed cell death protein 4 n=1 Tax=Monopterus albus TaxID=43700 RepID=A0A3Q3INZ2_MONAL
MRRGSKPKPSAACASPHPATQPVSPFLSRERWQEVTHTAQRAKSTPMTANPERARAGAFQKKAGQGGKESGGLLGWFMKMKSLMHGTPTMMNLPRSSRTSAQNLVGPVFDRHPWNSRMKGDTVYETVVPEVDEGELEKMVNPIVREYFEHGDTKEVQLLLKGLNLGPHKYEFSSLAVSLSLEGKASHRELTSRLLSDLSGKLLSQSDMARAFDKMLKELPDLILDTPEAPQMLGQFIARAIADHVLPMSFLDCYKGKVDCEHSRVALDRAAVLLKMKTKMVRLDNVWGVGGGLRPVKHLVKEMNLLLKEYLISGDVNEAEHCLRDLEVPHFHHELVYEAVVMVLESKGDTASHIMIKLLQSFWKTGLITVDQMNRGFQRVYDELPEISLDVPHAHSIMETFVDLCYQESVITKQLRDACPSRGRKRFVSEGDGGVIKN